MGGNKGFTNRAKSGAVAQRARIAQRVERQKADAKPVARPAPKPKPAAKTPEPK